MDASEEGGWGWDRGVSWRHPFDVVGRELEAKEVVLGIEVVVVVSKQWWAETTTRRHWTQVVVVV